MVESDPTLPLMGNHSCKICRADQAVRDAVEKDIDANVLLRVLEGKWGYSRSMLSLHSIWLKEEKALALRRKQMQGRQVDLRNRRVIAKQPDGRFRLAVVYDGLGNAAYSGEHGKPQIFVDEADLKANDVVMTVTFDPLPAESDQEEKNSAPE